MTSAYALRSYVFLTSSSYGIRFIRDELPEERRRNIDFHVASGDYFGTLATIMGLIADSLSSNGRETQKQCANTLDQLREDLNYSQETYTIQRK